jgi:hypothetical protein
MEPEQAKAWLSEPRYRNFLSAAEGDHAAAVELYLWNAEVSAAILGTLHHVEVFLRNTIDRQFPAGATERQISICNPDIWLTDPAILEDRGREKVNEAIARLMNQSRRPTRPRLVASLTFGFWAALFAGRYEDLWRSNLRHAFPNGDGRRNSVRKATARIIQLRNQTAHHEAIFGRNLSKDHETMLEVTGWIDEEARDYIAGISQVGTLLARQP